MHVHAHAYARARARVHMHGQRCSRRAIRAHPCARSYVSRLYRYHRISVEHVSLTCTYVKRARVCADVHTRAAQMQSERRYVREQTRGRANAARVQFLGRDAHTRARTRARAAARGDMRGCIRVDVRVSVYVCVCVCVSIAVYAAAATAAAAAAAATAVNDSPRTGVRVSASHI